MTPHTLELQHLYKDHNKRQNKKEMKKAKNTTQWQHIEKRNENTSWRFEYFLEKRSKGSSESLSRMKGKRNSYVLSQVSIKFKRTSDPNRLQVSACLMFFPHFQRLCLSGWSCFTRQAWFMYAVSCLYNIRFLWSQLLELGT